MKQFVMELYTESECFQHIITAVPGLSYEKIKAGVFDGPQIRTHIRDEKFAPKITALEKAAWLFFVAFFQNFSLKEQRQKLQWICGQNAPCFPCFHEQHGH